MNATTLVPVTRWVEPFAGMLAVALRLRGGERCEPPIAYMGGKRTFAGPILHGLGIRSGSGCRDLWVADSGPPGAFWQAMADNPDAVTLPLRDLATSREPATVDEARALYAEMADRPEPWAWLVAAGWAFRAGQANTGFKVTPKGGPALVSARLTSVATRCAKAAAAVRGARVWHDARDIPVEVVGRTVVLLDPPYAGTTGYVGGDFPRDEVHALALRWYEAGAEVIVTEREAVVPDWRSVRIERGRGTGGSAGLWERATLSPNIAWRGGEALSLFGDDTIAPRGSAMVGGAR